MKLKELHEGRPFLPMSSLKKELADLSHDLAVDGDIPKELKPEDITSDQANAYDKAMDKLGKKFPEELNPDQEREYADAQMNVAAKILKEATHPETAAKLRYAQYVYKLAKNDNPDITDQEMIKKLADYMKVDSKIAADYLKKVKELEK